MRLCLAVWIGCVAGPAMAAPAAELPQAPPEIMAEMDRRVEGTLDLVRVWVGDFSGDGIADAFVQAAVAIGGGNMVVFEHALFRGGPQGFAISGTVALSGGVVAVDIVPGQIDATLAVMMPGDPRCCPSGREVVRMTP